MENASKALIIAGAILLAIVIISLGLVVVGNVRDVANNTNLSEQEINAFNAKLKAFGTTNVPASKVDALIQTVISTNQATYDSEKSNFIGIAYKPANFPKVTNGPEYVVLGFASKTGPNQAKIGIGFAGPQSTIAGFITTNKSTIENAIGYKEDVHIRNGLGQDEATMEAMTSVKPGKTYNISYEINDKTGLIYGIKVE